MRAFPNWIDSQNSVQRRLAISMIVLFVTSSGIAIGPSNPQAAGPIGGILAITAVVSCVLIFQYSRKLDYSKHYELIWYLVGWFAGLFVIAIIAVILLRRVLTLNPREFPAFMVLIGALGMIMIADGLVITGFALRGASAIISGEQDPDEIMESVLSDNDSDE